MKVGPVFIAAWAGCIVVGCGVLLDIQSDGPPATDGGSDVGRASDSGGPSTDGAADADPALADGGGDGPKHTHPLVFVTSGKFSSALGGPAGADTICNSVAADAGLGGAYRAFLRQGGVSATTLIKPGPYYGADGQLTFASFPNDPAIPIRDERGDTTPLDVWTGELDASCGDWTNTAACGYGDSANAGAWKRRGEKSGTAHLYCFEN
ncbi:MAG: hypothetical protein JST00_13905 [Deltaproteobacteria bacterium]|nr:hypothetical protein [Deltaproteobacteria bacterium]